MANQWYQLILRQLLNGVSVETIWNYLIADATEQENENALATKFASDVLVLINDVQHAGCTNVELSVYNRTDGLLAYIGTIGGGGQIAFLANTIPPQQTSVYMRKGVGSSHLWENDTVVTSRPLRLGKVYIPGQNENIMSDYKIDLTFMTTEWEALQTQMAVNLALATGDTAQPVVHGYPLDSTPTEPTRGEVYAFISSATRRDISFLSSRKT